MDKPADLEAEMSKFSFTVFGTHENIKGRWRMITDKKRLIAELEKIIPDHALVEIERYVTRPGQSTHSMGYGGRPTDIVLGVDITDVIKLTVKYTQKCYD